MRKMFDSAVRWLRHPRLTLASNAAFVVGAGIFVASLVGGALKVLTTFPTVWLALSATGAFFTVTGGLGMLVRSKAPVIVPSKSNIEPVNDRENEKQEQLRQAIGRLLAELEIARGAIEKARRESNLPTLPTAAWEAGADLLSVAGLDDAHKAARVAYRHISELSGAWLEAWDRTEIQVGAIREAEQKLESALADLKDEGTR